MKRLVKGKSQSSKKTADSAKEAETPDRTLAEAQEVMGNSNEDEKTIVSSGNAGKKSSSTSNSRSASKKKKKKEDMTTEELLAYQKDQIANEKAGKRKLFHSLVKLANELRRTRNESTPLVELNQYAERNWYEGGLWRAPALLPGVTNRTQRITRLREAISLTDLFFNLVIVTAFTRVGVAMTRETFVDVSSLLYFGIFWNCWFKETMYSSRFDTTDLSAQFVTLVTCFVILFASLSVHASFDTVDGDRVMYMAAFVAGLHFLLHVRVALTMRDSAETMAQAVSKYAVFNMIMNFLEMVTWLVGTLVFPPDWPYRWLIFLGGIVLALRVPQAFLPNDFHAACSKRGVLFILLMGFLLQSLVVVASEFFEYQTPTLEHYGFIGAACLLFFCIKLLYVDDSDTLAEDHALLVNPVAGFFFHLGQFALLLSTTVMGSGLNLLTHDYLAATAALSGPSKGMVCGGFSAVLFSTLFIRSMHLRRIPVEGHGHCLFITAFVLQTLVLLAVATATAAMSIGNVEGTFLAYLLRSDIMLLVALAVAAFVVVAMSWLDEGVELILYQTAETSRSVRVHPFGFWWCLKPKPPSLDEEGMGEESEGFNALTPLLGSSDDLNYYQATGEAV
uniref:Uncharacterized protein n=1 Tax=Amphora coffeiformis TaxID=265554 RepID=A0A7S3P4C5_9STRA|mmetsp:Transcript_8399/g.16027  ORF Transcript_8399/g.16027 Transcript_8399/m.16027 type:complete len:619 (+) Transcript_8399:90-1946(+)